MTDFLHVDRDRPWIRVTDQCRPTRMEMAAAAEVEQRRIHQLAWVAFERGWDTALDLAVEVVRNASDCGQAREGLRRLASDYSFADQPPAECSHDGSQLVTVAHHTVAGER